MKHLRNISGAMLLIVIFIFSSQAENKYVGSKFCAACHKGGKGGTAYTVWEKGAHAKAYETLLGDEAKKFAKERGINSRPTKHLNA